MRGKKNTDFSLEGEKLNGENKLEIWKGVFWEEKMNLGERNIGGNEF